MNGISGNTIVGEYSALHGGTQAFEYNSTTGLCGVSGNTLVGTYQDSTGLNHGFVYDGTNLTTVDEPDSSRMHNGTLLNGVSGSAAIGYYDDSSDSAVPFEYQIIPSPPTASTPEAGSWALLAGVGATCAAAVRRRRSR